LKNILFIDLNPNYNRKTGFTIYTNSIIDSLKSMNFNLVVKNYSSLSTNLDSNKRMKQIKSLFSYKSIYEIEISKEIIENVKNEIIKIKPNIIILNHLKAAPLVFNIKNKKNYKFIYISHNSEYEVQYSNFLLSSNWFSKIYFYIEYLKIIKLESKILSDVNVCTTITNEDAIRYRKLKIKNIEFATLTPTIDLNLRENQSIHKSKKNLLILGSFLWNIKYKNVIWFIEKIFLKLSDLDLKLTIVGTGAEKFYNKYSNNDNIEVYPNVDDITIFYKNADIFIIPERQIGGLKLKALEASSFSLPIISTPEGIEGTFLKDKVSCYTANNTNQFIDNIKLCIDSLDIANNLGEKAFDNVNNIFTKDNQIKILSEIL